ncbi:MAG: hypothetical protein QOH88_1509 [Verrucomicrobiota bacterium]|jgi:hypothetical protein
MTSLPFRRSPLSLFYSAVLLFALTAAGSLSAAEEDPRPAMGIQDNSFLIEEAYNQEAGVVQHIFNLTRSVTHRSGPDDREWLFTFTQEWPIGIQDHQFSYTLPYSYIESGGQSAHGVGDVFINYRYQVATETATRPAFAPRFSLIVPTGDEDKGLGDGTVGYQLNLPVSKVVSDRWTLHANAGLTFLPDVQGEDLLNFNLGGSAIFAVSRRLNLMLEAVANFDEEAGGSREASVILSPGVRYAFNFKNDSQLVIGLAAPIGVSAAAPDYGVFVYFSYEHFFKR